MSGFFTFKKRRDASDLSRIAHIVNSPAFEALRGEIETFVDSAYQRLETAATLDEVVRLQTEIAVLKKILAIKGTFSPLRRKMDVERRKNETAPRTGG